MNSRQRRKQRRRFAHSVTVASSNQNGYELSVRLTAMEQWCHRRYGGGGYLFDWPDFRFPDIGRAMEFRMEWA
jgi:hypothetical protein